MTNYEKLRREGESIEAVVARRLIRDKEVCRYFGYRSLKDVVINNFSVLTSGIEDAQKKISKRRRDTGRAAEMAKTYLSECLVIADAPADG